MSRSSVKDLSSSTVSAAMPVSSFTSSARPARTSSVDSAMVSLLVVGRWNAPSYNGRGVGLALRSYLGQSHHLRTVDQARAESDLQGQAARELRVLLEQGVRGER